MKQTLGELIAGLRKEKGMTQLELAEKMGVTDKAVSKWERNLSCPDIQSIPKLAQILGVSVEDLLQSKQDTAEPRKNVRETVDLILKAVMVAMGIAVAVLSALGLLESSAGMTMLGIGLACGGMSLLPERR